jgi:hypothetical protein
MLSSSRVDQPPTSGVPVAEDVSSACAQDSASKQ